MTVEQEESAWSRRMAALAEPVPADDITHCGHGYSWEQLDEIAYLAARAWRFPKVSDARDYRAWAMDGVTELVLTAQQPPTVGDLIRAGTDAISAMAYQTDQAHGRPTQNGGRPSNAFLKFWINPPTVFEHRLVDKWATRQIMAALTPIEQDAVRVYALKNYDIHAAADFTGINASTFVTRLNRARRRFTELWYYPDPPAGFWKRSHQVIDTDERRATRRRTMYASLCKRNHGWDCGCGYADMLEEN